MLQITTQQTKKEN
jgi:hypothetical protein